MSGVVGPKKPAPPSVHSALAGMGVLSGEATTAQPTPAPWSEPCTFGLTKFEVQGDGKKVAVFERLEDAQHAVKCVNAHYTLVDALEWARIYVESASRRGYDGTNGQGIREEAARRLVIIDAAIAKAGSAT